VLVLPLLAGCSTHYVEVYITEVGTSCQCSADMGVDAVDNIFTYPGDTLVWINFTTGDVTLEPDSGLFEDVTYTIPSKGRALLPVLDDAAGNFSVTLTCHSGGVSGPVVVVGDPP
jgi:hypothetical protein